MSRERTMLVLDDHPVARQGLEMAVHMYRSDIHVLQAGTVKEAVACMEQKTIELVMVGVNIGKENGFTFLQWMRTAGKNCKVFFLTSSDRESDFSKAREFGVDAYVLKMAPMEEIVYGLRVLERGGKYYSSALIEKVGQSSDDMQLLNELTKRERDVLRLVSLGYSNAKISKTLYISEGTTKKHITSIFGKLGLKSRVEAAVFANRFMVKMDLDDTAT